MASGLMADESKEHMPYGAYLIYEPPDTDYDKIEGSDIVTLQIDTKIMILLSTKDNPSGKSALQHIGQRNCVTIYFYEASVQDEDETLYNLGIIGPEEEKWIAFNEIVSTIQDLIENDLCNDTYRR